MSSLKIPNILILDSLTVEASDMTRWAAVINVADSPCMLFRGVDLGVPSFWFPIHERGRWGYSAFFGAARVIDRYRNSEKPIVVHCHAGMCRSVSVVYAILAADGVSEPEINAMFPLYVGKGIPGVLSGPGGIFKQNISRGCIPRDVIHMLKARHDYKEFSLSGLLDSIKSVNATNPEYKR